MQTINITAMTSKNELLREVERALNSIPRTAYDNTDTYELVSKIGKYLRDQGAAMNTMTEVKQTIWYAGKQLYYTDTITESQPDAQDAMGNYIDEMQEALEMYKDRGVTACWIHEPDNVHHLYTERDNRQSPVMELNATAFIVDFQLKEIRQRSSPYNAIPFKEMDEDTKAKVRGIRAQYVYNDYTEGLDD